MARHYKASLIAAVAGAMLIAGAAPRKEPPRTLSPSSSSSRAAVYVEPSLHQQVGFADVIVTSRSASAAAAAVLRVGGRVRSELRIVNAVAATVPVRALERLAAEPGLVSVVGNKRVSSSAWNGWMSDMRVFRGWYQTSSAITAAATHLPDGGFAAVSSGGELLLVNADGSERKRVALATGTWPYAPLSTETAVTVVGDKRVVSYTPAGKKQWEAAPASDGFAANGVVGADETRYVVSSGGTVYALAGQDGRVLWSQSVSARWATVRTTPVLGGDGTLYVTSADGDVYAVNAAGVRWKQSLRAVVTAQPELVDGAFYVTTGARLTAIDVATGGIRFSFSAPAAISGAPQFSGSAVYLAAGPQMLSLTTAGKIRWTATSIGNVFPAEPVLAPDGTSVYAAAQKGKGKKTIGTLIALDAATGAQKWTYTGFGDLSIRPDVDPEGGILLADNQTSIYRLAPDGTETHRLKARVVITALSRSSGNGNMVVRLETNALALFGRLPEQWNGKKDVEKTGRNTIYRLANPVSVDVGADLLHTRWVANGQLLRGTGVGVVVIDSGVYWDAETKLTLGPRLQHRFRGQADFIDTQCGTAVSGLLGVQYDGYCFSDYNHSRDGYGHGTHVAGSIANELVDEATGAFLGIAPDAHIVSARVLGNDGTGSYESVIRGIQWAIENKAAYNIRVMNLSLSAYATVPYFVDPMCRAVERAWQQGIVVLAAAGNTGPFAQSITVPGNDPYVITVGAVSTNRTPAYWKDDVVPPWSATGPTFDGFPKPDIVAPGSQIVSYMYNDPAGVKTQYLVRAHPDYSETATLFRMNGTSMATAIASGVAALMVQQNPALTPDQVKYRLMNTSRMAVDRSKEPVFNTMQQGLGRVWAPDAVLDPVDPLGVANLEMDLRADLAGGYETVEELSSHYQGPVRRLLSDDGSAWLYYATDTSGNDYALGVTTLDGHWMTSEGAARLIWSGARLIWSGGTGFTGDAAAFGSARLIWSGSRHSWGSARLIWSGSRLSWAGARLIWSGGNGWAGGSAWGVARLIWSGSIESYGSARLIWSGSAGTGLAAASNSNWIGDDWIAPPRSTLPPPAATEP
ncbi:MAG TPA: S8 family serine peptidase [Thermoanaerobaculia bacterium]|nr:S8 family serine peptidase [Thermoanaerobaculia bacterium]